MRAHGHAIVCGLDHLGLRTVDELRLRDEEVVAIGESDEVEEQLTAAGVRLVVGDHRLPRVLREANVASASILVLTGDDDLGNLNTALAASEINPDIRIVIRMFDQELGAHIPDLFPDAVALSSSAVAAPGFVSAAVDGEAGTRFRLAGRILTSRRSVDPRRSTLSIPIARLNADRTVELFPDVDPDAEDLVLIDVDDPGTTDDDPDAQPKIDVPGIGAKVTRWVARVRARLAAPERRFVRFAAILTGLAIASAAFFYIVAGLSPLDAVSYAITLLTGAAIPINIESAASNGALRVYAILLSLVGAAIVAVVYAFITDALIRSRLLQTLGRRTIPSDIHDHVIVAGLGSIGYRVALAVRARGIPVVVVEISDESRFASPARAAKIPIFVGDARHKEVLKELRLDKARALVATTSDDLVNLSIALNARAVRPELRVVVRLYDPEFAIRVQHGFHIRFTRSVSHLAAPAFAAAAVGSEVVATVPVGDRRTVLFARLRVPAGSMLEGRMAASLDAPGALKLLAVADPGSDEARWDIPADEILDADEEVVVAATRAGLADLLHHARMVAGSIGDAPNDQDVVATQGGHGMAAVAGAVTGAVAGAAGRTVDTVTAGAAGAASAMSAGTKAAASAATGVATSAVGSASSAASSAVGAVGAVGSAIKGAAGGVGGSSPTSDEAPLGPDSADLAAVADLAAAATGDDVPETAVDIEPLAAIVDSTPLPTDGRDT